MTAKMTNPKNIIFIFQQDKVFLKKALHKLAPGMFECSSDTTGIAQRSNNSGVE